MGRLALGVDIRQYGDGNPGAANVWRAGGPVWGITAILLDGFKGAIPVGLAYHYAGLEGWLLAFTAIAPVAGHAFTPFLRFQGGKALAVTFGVWTGLTLWLIPLTMGLLFALCLFLLKPEGWAILVGLVGLLIALILFGSEPAFLAIWLGTSAILLWMQRGDLAERPRLRRRSAAG